jgi:hypothetical protein
MTMRMNLIRSRRAVRLLLAFSRRRRPKYSIICEHSLYALCCFVSLLLCTSVCVCELDFHWLQAFVGWMDGRTVGLAFKELLCIAKFDVLITAQ